MTSEPKAPGAPAIILFREVYRDDRGNTAHEDVYRRIKVLTEEGRKYADVEIPFFRAQGNVINIHGRTILPDGTIVNFSGKAFDKMIVKARGVKYMAKTFTLPNVQVGCILEYFYTVNLAENVVFDSHWILSDELYTKSAKFSLAPYTNDYNSVHLRWTWYLLPAGTGQPVEQANHVITLESSDIPAFQTEDYMPPENELKSRVDFIYSEDLIEKDPNKFWKKWGKKHNDQLESFVGKRKAMEEAVATISAPTDSSEVKLQKIYARVQQIRNTTYEEEKTEQEQKRSKEKEPNNVETIWKKEYGSGYELTRLFLALARAEGFDASEIWVADRQNYFFAAETMDAHRLDTNVVVVKVNGKDLFFDPGAAFTPFGMLPWSETGVKGIKLDKDGGSWIQTPVPSSADSVIDRKADLKLNDTGDLEGKLTVTYTGLEASQRRVEERLVDDTERKKFLEDEVRDMIPAACELDLTNKPDWKSTAPLTAEFTLKVPGWVQGAGRHGLMTLGLFSANEKHLFDHAERVHAIYFQYPFRSSDQINIEMPSAWQVSSVPKPSKVDATALVYTSEAKKDSQQLHVSRVLNMDVILLPVDMYANLRKIFQIIRTGDEQQVVLEPGATKAAS
ncbi:MAG TPA: DUF3857 domain-containing protein [Candidatus Sulfotelmatobacter sp.]|nr:DUF3857 domain-containing protein [Candidatus Sulfotelmatobacter sp.]